MRSLSTRRKQSAMLTGFASFVFFTLVWRFTGTFSLAVSLGLAAIMGVTVAFGNWGLTRSFRDGGVRR